jgi:hypothetical protein
MRIQSYLAGGLDGTVKVYLKLYRTSLGNISRYKGAIMLKLLKIIMSRQHQSLQDNILFQSQQFVNLQYLKIMGIMLNQKIADDSRHCNTGYSDGSHGLIHSAIDPDNMKETNMALTYSNAATTINFAKLRVLGQPQSFHVFNIYVDANNFAHKAELISIKHDSQNNTTVGDPNICTVWATFAA